MEEYKILELESIASKRKETISCLSAIISTVPFLCLGIYYWIVDDIIFSYDIVGPFSGFSIFAFFAIVSISILYFFVNKKWKSYNQSIDKANEELEKLLQNEFLSDETYYRIRKGLIERKMLRREALTEDEFQWHTSRICWCCGEPFTGRRVDYIYEKDRSVSEKNGAIRKTTTYTKSAKITICIDCYKKLMSHERQEAKNGDFVFKVDSIISIAVTVCYLVYNIFDDMTGKDYSIWENLGSYLFLLIASFGVCCTLGQIIIFPISYLISYPFLEKKSKYIFKKWDFDNIPEIRKFIEEH